MDYYGKHLKTAFILYLIENILFWLLLLSTLNDDLSSSFFNLSFWVIRYRMQ